MIGRRVFMRGVAGLGAALAGDKALAGRPGEAGGLVAMQHAGGPAGVEVGVSAVKRAARALLGRRSEEINWRAAYRINGFDHDIAALGSVAPWYRAQLQRRRDHKAMSMIRLLQSRAWD